MNHARVRLNRHRSLPPGSWSRWAIAVLLLTWLMAPSIQAQSVDLDGWYVRTEQSGTLRCTGNRWQQAELLGGVSYTWDGTYTAIRKDARTIEITAEPMGETARTWLLDFDSANAGTYTLDYLLLADYTIHEEGRFYHSPAGLGFADWAQMTGETRNGPEPVWEFLTGETAPGIRAEKKGGSWEFVLPVKLAGRNGVIELEESLDLKSWRVSAGPIQIGTAKQRYYRLRASLAPRPVMDPTAAVHVGGGTLIPGTTLKFSELTTVSSLEITAPNGSPTPIQITESAKPEATVQIRPLTGLIGIQGLEALAVDPIEVRINVSVPQDHFAMGFIFDRDTGRFEGMPLKELAADHVTVLSRHFCEFLLLEIPIAELPEEVDSGFRPGVDDWEFTNFGSYIARGGHCAGQAVSAMYYYVNERQKRHAPRLYRLWDNPGNDWETPGIETDNQRGYALASMAQNSIDWNSFSNDFWFNLSPGDLNTYRCFVFSMWVTGEPQEVNIRRPDGGHAIVGWKCAYGSIHVADPNYPGNDTRWINFNTTSNLFEPYYSGPTAADLGVAYPKIIYYGKTTMIDWDQLGKLWDQAKAGTIGAGVFPRLTLEIVNEDRSVAGIVTNSMAGGIVTVPITGRSFAYRPTGWDRYKVYHADGGAYEHPNGWIETEGETNLVGFELFKTFVVGTNTDEAWVGFQWLNITRPPIKPVTISIAPSSVTLAVRGTQNFTATVTGTADPAVDWSIQEGTAGGTITGTGAYIAPNAAGTYHVVAVSRSNPTVFATATITVEPPPPPWRFSTIDIGAWPGIVNGVNCSGSGLEGSAHVSSEGGIPVVWSDNQFSVAGSTAVTNSRSVKHVTVSISGTVNADGTISLSGTSQSTTVEAVGFTGGINDLTETATSITVERMPRNPLFQDSVHWLVSREADRPCLKAVSCVTTVTRQFADGSSEARKSCTMTEVNWKAYGVVQVNGG